MKRIHRINSGFGCNIWSVSSDPGRALSLWPSSWFSRRRLGIIFGLDVGHNTNLDLGFN